jgi:hypothetical protein
MRRSFKDSALKLYLTAETQRAQREYIFIKNLCGLCASAVNDIKMTEFLLRAQG